MAGEDGREGSHVVDDPDRALPVLQLDNLVEKDERLPVGDDRLDFTAAQVRGWAPPPLRLALVQALVLGQGRFEWSALGRGQACLTRGRRMRRPYVPITPILTEH